MAAFQSGFRSLDSTKSVSLKVLNDTFFVIDSGHYALLALIDLSSEFDMVDRNILLS